MAPSYSESTHLLPSYQQVSDDLVVLNLPFDVAKLHGLITGFLVTNCSMQAENYLRSLLMNKSGPDYRQSTNVLLTLLTMTQTWLNNFGFDFCMLLPHDDTPLPERVMAFANWVSGFLDAINLSGLSLDDVDNEELVEILQHFEDFSQMEVDEFDFDNEDEKAYVDVTEYARLAILQLFCEFNQPNDEDKTSKTQHH